MRKELLLKFINYWPPYWGSGIRVVNVSPDNLSIDVELKLRFWNKNYVGTLFGGSLYAMTDPFFMMILLKNLGRDYIVWDKAAAIRFKKPGKGTVRAHFHIPRDEVDAIRAAADANYKVEPQFTVNVVDEDGDVVAEIDKLLYVRHKSRVKETKPVL